MYIYTHYIYIYIDLCRRGWRCLPELPRAHRLWGLQQPERSGAQGSGPGRWRQKQATRSLSNSCMIIGFQ